MNKNESFVAVLGCGVLGTIMAQGLNAAQARQSYKVVATCRTLERAEALSRSLGIACLTDNRKAVEEADLVVLAVRPQSMSELLREIAPSLKPGTLCVTIAAGLSLRFYEELLPDHVAVIRAHPSPMMSVRRGCIALSKGERASDDDVQKAERLFSLFSEWTVLLPERDINMFAAMFGSSSALLYLFVDALLAAGEEKGQPQFCPKQIIAAMLDGASHMLLKSGKSARKLSEEICTPNGMTIAGVNVWEKNNVGETVSSAMRAVFDRVSEMAVTIK